MAGGNVKLNFRWFFWMLAGYLVGALAASLNDEMYHGGRFKVALTVGIGLGLLIFIFSVFAQLLWVKFIEKIKEKTS